MWIKNSHNVWIKNTIICVDQKYSHDMWIKNTVVCG